MIAILRVVSNSKNSNHNDTAQSQTQSDRQKSSSNSNDGEQTIDGIPASYYDEDSYRDSYKKNMTPRQRYDYDNWQVYYQNLTPEQQSNYQNQMSGTNNNGQ